MESEISDAGFLTNQFELCRNPLELPPIIKCVFKYLGIEDAINSRLVSKEWSSVGLSVLTKRANIEFDLPGSIWNFYQVFSNTSFKTVGFKNITFSGLRYEKPWSVDELNEFFEREGQHITKLKLNEIQLVDNCFKNVSNFSITPWLSNCVMTQSKTKGITKLSITCDQDFANLSVDLSSLSCIKQLTLRRVSVNIQDGIQINPNKLKMRRVSFFKDGNKLTRVHLNDIFNFSETKYLSLKGLMHEGDTKLSLDLTGCCKFEHLELWHVKLINLKYCRWEVNELTIFNVTFTETTQMQIKELVVEYCESLDISNIPLSIEKMTFTSIGDETFLFSQRVVFQNIKFLHLNFKDNVIPLFNENLIFPNLTHLHLRNSFDFDLDMELDVAQIPKTVKVMSLTKIKISNSGNDRLKLERLILTPLQPLKIGDFCAGAVRTKDLVLDFTWRYGEYQNNRQQIWDILEHQKICKECIQCFYVGNLDWGVSDFDSSCPLYSYVDKKAGFYIFDNQKGKAINEQEFPLLIDLNKLYNEMK